MQAEARCLQCTIQQMPSSAALSEAEACVVWRPCDITLLSACAVMVMGSSSLVLPRKLPAVYEVLGIGGHELCDEHGAARVHAGAQELHHMDIPAVLQDGDLHQQINHS